MHRLAPRALLIPMLLVGGCATAPSPRAPLSSSGGVYNRSTHHLVQDDRIRDILAQQVYHREDLLRVAQMLNHELLSARSATLAARGRRRQAALWPNPMLDVMQGRIGTGPLSLSGSETSIEIAQPLPVSPRRRRAIAVGRAEEAQLAAQHAATERRILAAVDRYHTDILAYIEAERLQMELMELAEELLQGTRTAHAEGRASAGDLARMRYERYFAEYEVTRIVAERIYLTQELAVFLGLPEVNAARIAGSLIPALTPEDIAFERDRIVADHPALAAADLAVALREATWRLARAAAMPDPTVRAGVAYDWEGDETFLRAGIGIPLPVFDRAQGRLEEARVLLAQAEHDRDQVALELRSELIEALQQISEFDTLALVWRIELIPAAAESLADVRERYSTGDATGLELVDAFRTYSTAERQLVEHVRNLNLAFARLRGVLGYPETDSANR